MRRVKLLIWEEDFFSLSTLCYGFYNYTRFHNSPSLKVLLEGIQPEGGSARVKKIYKKFSFLVARFKWVMYYVTFFLRVILSFLLAIRYISLIWKILHSGFSSFFKIIMHKPSSFPDSPSFFATLCVLASSSFHLHLFPLRRRHQESFKCNVRFSESIGTYLGGKKKYYLALTSSLVLWILTF